MRNAIRRVAPFLIAALTAASAHAQTADQSISDDSRGIRLDIDRDGKPDHATLLRNPKTTELDLQIEPGAWNDNPLVSRRLAVSKTSIASGRILDFAVKRKHSLVITTGCGGCSNDVSTTLTIAYRGGAFVVAGYILTWDTRTGSGTCDVNFLAGRGTLSRDGGKPRALKGRFVPVKLEDWSDDKRPKGCE